MAETVDQGYLVIRLKLYVKRNIVRNTQRQSNDAIRAQATSSWRDLNRFVSILYLVRVSRYKNVV